MCKPPFPSLFHCRFAAASRSCLRQWFILSKVGAMRRLSAALLIAAIVIPCPAQDVFSLQKCGTLAIPRQRHASIVAKERLYLIGGQTAEGFTTSVQSAPLLEGYKMGK